MIMYKKVLGINGLTVLVSLEENEMGSSLGS